MNIENRFNNAKTHLEMAKDKVSAQDYGSALDSLTKAYSNIRELINQVSSLQRLKAEMTRPAGEDS